MTEATAFLPGLSPVSGKEITATFDGGQLSSDGTFETLRRAFLKIAVRVEELKSRIKVAFPSAYPHARVLALLAGSVTVRSP